ncbi:MAG: hypothetical protein ACRD0U_07105 [Acidimicrobiales bacterium]
MRSGRNDVDVDTGSADQTLDVLSVQRGDPVVIGGQDHDRRVDRVTGSGVPEEHAGTAAEDIVEAYDIDVGESSSKRYLAAVAASPDLSDDASVGDWRATGAELGATWTVGHAVTRLGCGRGVPVSSS